MNEYIVVYVTVGSSGEAERLSRALVEEKLAACVNRVRAVQSVYRWEGKIEVNEEDLLIIKTKRDLFDRLTRRVGELHSYTVPEVIALPIVEGSPAYLQWLGEQVAGNGR